jgi:hypothetical protein
MTTAQLAARRTAALDRSRADLDRVIGSPQWGWHVDSATDPRVTYTVTPRFTCNCPAGLAGVPCRHAAACWRLAHGLGRARVAVRG